LSSPFRAITSLRFLVGLQRRLALVAAVALPLGCDDSMAPSIVEPLQASARPVSSFVPIGADYQPATLTLFLQQALAHDRDGEVQIRVLLPPFSTDSTAISPEDRALNLEDAQVRADNLQVACDALVAPPTTCAVSIPDIQIRSDAQAADKVAQFALGVDGVYALGGDQVIAMEIIAGTPLETALEVLHRDGVPLGGNSAGCAIQGRYMIAGLTGDNFAWDGLERGAVDLAYGAVNSVRRGLRFGIDRAIIEQHALQRGRLIRSLQAVQQSPAAKIGLGPDWRTGVLIRNYTEVLGTAGLSSAFVIDQETFGAAAGAAYRGDRQSLSLRNVALHLLAAGDHGYDLAAQRPTLRGQLQRRIPQVRRRTFELLRAAPHAGPLFIAGDLLDADAIVPVALGAVFDELVTAAQAAGGKVVLLAVGDDAATAAELVVLQAAMAARSLSVTVVTLTSATDPAAVAPQLAAAGTIYVTAEDQPAVAALIDKLAALRLERLHAAGKVLLFDNAAAAAVGDWMVAEATPEDRLRAKEDAATPPYLASYDAIKRGLGLVRGATFEARTFYDYRFGRLIQQGYRHRGTVAFGLEREAALRIDATGATVRGPAAVIVIDPRLATRLEEGTNGAIAAFWLLLDTFTTGEKVQTAAP
jgi:cyanophycinase